MLSYSFFILLIFIYNKNMEEKIYKTMSSTGAANLAIGICVLVGGIVSGILLIVNGARLLKHKGKIMF